MSYVYCGHCGERGHNKLSCSHRKAWAKENPNSVTAMELKSESERRRRSVAKRACSYCREQGHNRSTCKVLKRDKLAMLKAQNHFREETSQQAHSSGLGPGAIVCIAKGEELWSSPTDPWDKNITLLVTEMLWDNLSFLQGNNYTSLNRAVARGRVIRTDGYKSEKGDNRHMPAPRQNELYNITYGNLLCISRVLANRHLENPTSTEELEYFFNRNEGQHGAAILSPSKIKFAIPTLNRETVADLVLKEFNMHSTCRDKKRRHNDSPLWQKIYHGCAVPPSTNPPLY